jgi:sortase (surface protein transpeptidase)
VITPDPLQAGAKSKMLTLTTCNPRFSNAERLIVFAELAA